MTDKPNWKKGDIVVFNGVIFEAEHDPEYCASILGPESWYYGLRDCKEIRLATIDDIDHKIQFQKEKAEREQSRLDKLLNFRDILEKTNAT